MATNGGTQMKKISYKLYATLLDSYQNYIDSDKIYQKYYGFSDNPPLDEDEFREQQFQELIDRINRKPFYSEKADRGTAFNEVIDCIIENRKSETVKVERVYIDEFGYETNESGYGCILDKLEATYNNHTFTFPISVCREFADYFKGALTQQRVEAILPTAYGNVLVYGLIDELMPTTVHDIKTTGSYSVGKFKNHFQHLVYLYCLNKNGVPIKDFEYNIVEFGKNGNIVGTYTELYNYNPDTYIPKLTSICEEFICFLNDNKDLITDLKIFGKDGK